MSGGYAPHYAQLLAGLGIDALDEAEPTTAVDTRFLAFLLREFARLLPFDAAHYLAAYPDVRAAVTGDPAAAREHFVRCGFAEGRASVPLSFDATTYAAVSPDLAGLSAQALRAHYEAHGRREGRPAAAGTVADAARWAQAVAATMPTLIAATLAHQPVQAFLAPVVDGPPLGFRGGPVLGGGARDRRLRHRRDHRAVDSFPGATADLPTLAGAFVYAGPSYDHFGHVMAEMVHRILPARQAFDCRRLLLVGTAAGPARGGHSQLAPAWQAALRVLAVDPEDVTVIGADCVVERLHVAQQGSEFGCGPSAPYLALLDKFTPARLAQLGTQGAGARLYVSCGRITHGGSVLGERYLEQLLRAEGFTILHPQDLPLEAQMAAYAAADVVVFAEGSACHGAELLGPAAMAQCVLLLRRADHRAIYEAVLRPRARRFDVVAAAEPLGSVAAHPATGAPLAHMGVALYDIAALAQALRGLGVARLAGLDPPAYRHAARAGLAAYLAHHRDAGTGLDPAQAAAFAAGCAARLA